MRELVQSYLESGLSRRGFVKRMVQSGFSVMAANSVLAALPPAFGRAAEDKRDEPLSFTRPFRGTGGELLAEQLHEAGVEYVFLGNGSGMNSFCDALVDRPDLKIIQAVHEGLCVSMADGYYRASLKTAFSTFSREGIPNASSNTHNAMNDRSSLVLVTDRAEIPFVGRGGQGDPVEDTLEPDGKFSASGATSRIIIRCSWAASRRICAIRATTTCY